MCCSDGDSEFARRDVGSGGGSGVGCVVGGVWSCECNAGCGDNFGVAGCFAGESGCATHCESVAQDAIISIGDGCTCGAVIGFVVRRNGHGK